MKNLLLVLFMITFAAFEGCSKNSSGSESQNNNQQQKVSESNAAGSKAPEFSLPDVNGKPVKLSDYKGKVVIVDFWATWCPPCRKGIPDLISLQKEFGKDIVVIGISLDTDTKSDVAPFIKNMGINYPVAYGNLEVTQMYGNVEAIPTSFVIDKQGNIVDKHVGLVSKDAYTSVIKQLLSKS